jgi:hypothetical protein
MRLLLIGLALLSAVGSTAQTVAVEAQRQAVLDTLALDSTTSVILYDNNTWKYYRPALRALDTLDIFLSDWDTTQLFAYPKVELKDLPDTMGLTLAAASDDYHYPVLGNVFSKYGPRGYRSHNGVDIPLKTGDPVYAVFSGKARYARYNSGGFGRMVILRHANGLETWYAHLSKLNVAAGDNVVAGQVIGFGGSTGRSRGPHLHFEVRYADQTFDPERLIDFPSGKLLDSTFILHRSFFSIYSRASDQLDEEELAAADSNVVAEIYHTIRQGDMLGKIARRYGVSIDQICRLNPGLTRTTTLRLGRKIRVK